MHIASGLRRRRDEIAATIAAYEARIDAAGRDLAAPDQAAQLFDLEASRDDTAIPWSRDRLKKPEESSNRLAKLPRGRGRSPRADGLLRSRGFKTYSADSRGWSHPPRPGQLQKGYQKIFFIWSGRNSLKSLDAKK